MHFIALYSTIHIFLIRSPYHLHFFFASNHYRYHQGQVCTASSRVYVHEKVYDAFLSNYTEIVKVRLFSSGYSLVHGLMRYAGSVQALPSGDPLTPTIFNGPLISQTHFDVCFLSTYFRI